MDLRPLVVHAHSLRATDIHLSHGIYPHFRIDGELVPQEKYGEISGSDIEQAVRDLFEDLGLEFDKKKREIDFSFTVADR